jgi:hypothetical protein
MIFGSLMIFFLQWIILGTFCRFSKTFRVALVVSSFSGRRKAFKDNQLNSDTATVQTKSKTRKKEKKKKEKSLLSKDLILLIHSI